MMTEVAVTFRIYIRNAEGQVQDLKHDMELADFAGAYPSVGDKILEAGVGSNCDRYNPMHRKMWVVVERIFNPNDNADYIALVVESRSLSDEETAFVL